MNEPIDRLPPSDREAEKSLLAVMLQDHRTVPEIVGLVRASDFYLDSHRRIFDAITSLADAGKVPDLVSVMDWLTQKNWHEDAGGAAYLAELFDRHGAVSFKQHAEIVRGYAARRALIDAASEFQMAARDLGTPPEEMIAEAERRIMEIGQLGVSGEAVSLQAAMRETYDRLDARRGRKDGEASGVGTGFIDLDTLLCGFQSSELVIVGARPSVGKTAFALALARHATVEQGLPTLFVSLEQARVEIAERLLCAHGRIDSHRMRRGHLTYQDESDILTAGEVLAQAPLHIDDSPAQTMLRVAANARRMKQRHDIQFIVVDYLQLIVSENHRASRQEQVADVSRRLKALARELKVPVVACCQVNRGPEDRTDKRPRLSDLRESGAIEADADTVMLLHRREDGQSENLIEVIVAKQRNGPTGDVTLLYVKQHMRFENFAMGST